MTRIIGGRAAGTRLQVPARGTRPTSDRVREAMFSSLEHRLGGWQGVRVLDCYAGSGALGLEALSRGAETAIAVEQAPNAAAAIARNAKACRLDIEVVRAEVNRFLAGPATSQAFDLVLLDPPYETDAVRIQAALRDLATGWLTDDALVVLEAPVRGPRPAFPSTITIESDKRYGDTRLWYGRHNPEIG